MKPIAIIPARSGSKRIPRKNIISIGNQSALGLLISNLQAMDLFEKIVVSSDDEEITRIALQYGAYTSMRSSVELSNDITPSEEVIRDYILKNNLQAITNPVFCIYPLALLLSKENLIESLKLLHESPDFFIISAGELETNPLRHTFKNGPEGVEILFPENNKLRSQDLSPVYSDAGMFYLAFPKIWMNTDKYWYNNNAKIVHISKENAIDVDTYDDLQKLVRRFNHIQSEKKLL